MTTDATPPHATFLDCADCTGVALPVHHPGKVMSVQVAHDATCPAWRSELPEVALVLLPHGHPLATP